MLLSLALATLLFLASLLSQERGIPEDFIDAVIYTIYLLLVVLLGTISFVGYAFFDQKKVAGVESPQSESGAAFKLEPPLKRVEQNTTHSSKKRTDNGTLPETMSHTRKRVQTDMFGEMPGFALVEAAHPKPMARYLMKQHPQVCAAVMMHIDTKKADAILEHFETSQRGSLIKQVENSRPVAVSVLKSLDMALYQELTPFRREYARLGRLGNNEIREILRQIDKRELMFALNGATQELQERFFANMSSKASGEFRSKMASAPFPGMIKTQNALKKLSLLAEQLRDDGRIQITKNV